MSCTLRDVFMRLGVRNDDWQYGVSGNCSARLRKFSGRAALCLDPGAGTTRLRLSVPAFLAPMRGSAPLRSRAMLARCTIQMMHRQHQRQRRIELLAEGEHVGRRQRGRDQRRQRRDAEERTRPRSRSRRRARPAGQNSAMVTPKKVDTPLPPLKLSHTGKRWPSTAPSAPHHGHVVAVGVCAGSARPPRPCRHRTGRSPPPPISCPCAAHWWRRYCRSRSCAHRRRRTAARRTGRTGSSPADSRTAARPA